MAGADRSTLIHLAILLVRLPALPAASVAAGHCVSTEFPGVGFPWRVGVVRESIPDLASAVVLWLPLVHATAFKDSLASIIFFLLFQMEFTFAVFTTVTCLGVLALSFRRPNSLKMAVAICAGASCSILVFLAQLITVSRLEGVSI